MAMVRSMSNVDADPMVVYPANWMNVYCFPYIHSENRSLDEIDREMNEVHTIAWQSILVVALLAMMAPMEANQTIYLQ